MLQMDPSPDQLGLSWFPLTCIVIAFHSALIGFSLFFDSTSAKRPPIPQARLIVQTIDLSPVKTSTKEIALAPNPLPRNPIPHNPLPSNPIPKTPLTPTPLEHKTMPKWEDQIKTPSPQRAPDVPPKPAPTEKEPSEEQKTEPTPLSETKTPPILPKPPKSTPSAKSKTPQKPVKPPSGPPKKEAKPKVVKKTPPKPTPKPAPKSPVKKPAPVPEKSIDKAAADKKAAEEAKQKKKAEEEAEKKKAETERQQKLLASAQEKMAKIATVRNQAASSEKQILSPTPSAITQLQIDALPSAKGAPALSHKEISYRDELAGRLKLLLRLPEYGEVKIHLTLSRNGKVANLSIASAESEANRKYIEKTLPTLSFPAFGSNFESLAEYTFAINLSNES